MNSRAKRLTFVALASFAIGALPPPQAFAAECAKETRNLSFGEGTAAVRSYLCRESGEPLVRVAFQRLDEISTVGLFKGAPFGPVGKILGDAPFEENRLYTQLKDVFDRFAQRPEYDFKWNYTLSVPGGAAGAGGSLQGYAWEVGSVSYIPLPQEAARVKRTLRFPSKFSFFYKENWDKCRQWPLTCTILWRYMTESDVKRYDDNIRLEYEASGLPYDPENVLRDNYLKMLLYMAKGQWPKHFEFIHGNYDECAGSFVFSYLSRALLFDIAVIENLSDRQLDLDALWGTASALDGLRQIGSDSGAPRMLPVAKNALSPGGKLAVPLRFRLVAKKSSTWKDISKARKVYSQIRRGNKNQVVSASEWESGFKKKRGAFGPPSSPIIKNYVYGQAIDLKGLVVGGERLTLEGSSANYLELTMAFEGASCPYLYSWNADTKVWERYGKVIVRANDRAKERSETIAFAGLKHRFKLREEELEITYLDRVGLTLHLSDGRSITLAPEIGKLAKKDGNYLLLRPGEAAELTFDVSGIEPDEVKESALMVTGFYRPFSSIMDVSRLTSSAAP